MQPNRSGGDPFFDFGDPFAGFGGLGGFGGRRSLMSSFFGGRDPFNDPFFTRPFGGMFESSFFGSGGSPFADMHQSAFLDHQAPEPKNSRGPIIEELNSDDDKEESENEKRENPRKHGRSSKEPYVEEPDNEVEERKSKYLQLGNSFNRFNEMEPQPQARSFTFQSSTVTYGGTNGAYHTSSKSRRMGSDGVMLEESKEADSTTGRAAHRISRGLHNKGHTVTRKLGSGGRVDTTQTLHNLNEDELYGFEEAWKGHAGQHLPGWSGSMGAINSTQNAETSRGGWALPSTEPSRHSKRMIPEDTLGGAGLSTPHPWPGRMKGASDARAKNGTRP